MKGIAPVAALILIGVLFVAAIMVTGQFKFETYCSGFSALSVSQVNFQSNDAMLNKPAWLVSAILNCHGQSIQGTITKDQIKGDGKQATQGFSINMLLKENRLQFPVAADTSTATSGKIYTVAVQKLGSGGTREQQLAICTQQVGGGYDVVNPPALYGPWYCLQRFEQGTLGRLAEGTEIFAADISLKPDTGSVSTATINNVDQTSAFVGSLAHVQWQGSLVTGQEVPDPANQDICGIWKFDHWETIACSAYTSWEIQYQNFRNCVYGISTDSTQQCADTTNNPAATILAGKQFKTSTGTVATTTGQLSNGIVSLELAKQFTFPVMTLRVDANTLGIYVPVGKPQIVSVSSDKFRTGTTGTIEAVVKNVGDALGSFDVSAVCNSPFNSNDRMTVSLNPNLQTTIYLRVNGETTQYTTGTCSVKAYDINNPNNVDTKTVQVSVDIIIQCTPNAIVAEGRFLKKCRSDGGGWDIIQTCPEGQVADPISQGCKDGGGTGGDDCFLGLCNLGDGLGNLFFGIIGAILLIVLIAVIVVIIVLIYKFYRWVKS